MLTYPIALQDGPGPLLAFAPEPDPDALAETMVALANADGGSIVLGVDAQGAPTGAFARRLRRGRPRCDDRGGLRALPPRAQPGAARVGGARAWPAAGGARPARRAGPRAGRWPRAGARRGWQPPAERRRHPAADRGAFARRFRERAGPWRGSWSRADGDPWEGSYAALLASMGALTPDRRPTVAGMLLFGRDPQRWLPSSGARFVRYLGSGDDRAQRVAEERVSGPLVRVVERLAATVREQLGAGATAYPARAVREALINALLHRDYRLRGTEVEVRLYADRLEIHSPSGLPGFLSVEDLLSARYSRNPRLAWALHQWGYVPEPGRGIRRMCEEMAEQGRRPPEFEAAPYRLTVRLYRSPVHEAAPGANGNALSQRQRAALAYVRAQGSITFREFRALALGVRPELLQDDLDALVAAGYLRRIGQRVGAYYILP